MMKNMVTSKPLSVIHHENETYRPNKKGVFVVNDAHVAAMRAHGLRLEGEPEDIPATLKSKDDEIAALKASNADLAKQNADILARLTALEAKK